MIQLSRRTVALVFTSFLAVAAVAATSLVLTLAGRADAAHTFNDIQTGNFFHDSTAWLADNGIADGFGDGSFHPNANITRGQASYWFANNNDALELVETQSSGPGSNARHSLLMVCPTGKRAMAGGGDATAPGDEVLFMTENFPFTSGQWAVTWKTADGTPTEPVYLSGWALCVPDTIPD